MSLNSLMTFMVGIKYCGALHLNVMCFKYVSTNIMRLCRLKLAQNVQRINYL